MILEHYSSEPLRWPPRNYGQYPLGTDGNFKPKGLWVSVPGEDDWPSWCRGEEFALERLAVRTRVLLKPDACVHLIDNEADLLKFDADYGIEFPITPDFNWHQINWRGVASDYDGIIIAPYQWSCRLPMHMEGPRHKVSRWYYPWDVASGCIWNGNCIAAFHSTTDEIQSGDGQILEQGGSSETGRMLGVDGI